jgi:hypothetical protein
MLGRWFQQRIIGEGMLAGLVGSSSSMDAAYCEGSGARVKMNREGAKAQKKREEEN